MSNLIGTAIQSALRMHQENKVSWSQIIDPSKVTIASNESLPLPLNYFAIDSIRLIYGSNDDKVLDIIGWTEMQKEFDNFNAGRTTVAAIYAGVAKLRPIPNAVWTSVITGYQKFIIPVASGDTHPWMTNAENLIKWQAKAYLYADVLEDENRAAYFEQKAAMELSRILRSFMAETQSNQLAYN